MQDRARGGHTVGYVLPRIPALDMTSMADNDVVANVTLTVKL